MISEKGKWDGITQNLIINHTECVTLFYSLRRVTGTIILIIIKYGFFMFLNLIYLYGVDVVLENVASVAEIFSASHENHLLRCEDEF